MSADSSLVEEPGRPEWANFRLLGDWAFTLGSFLNYKSNANFWHTKTSVETVMYLF
jgi:hypothetical protein